MPYVSAQVRIGYQVLKGSPALSDWTDQDRAQLCARATAEVAEKIPQSFRDAWEYTAINVEGGGVPEEAVRAFLQAKLDELNALPERPWILELADQAPQPAPDGIKYIYFDNTRVCVHDYEMVITPKGQGTTGWKVKYQPPGKPEVVVTIFAELAWPGSMA